MLIYVLTLLIPSSFFLLNINLDINLKKILTYSFILYLIVFIGLREHTGGDWGGHLSQFYQAQVLFDYLNFDFRGDYFYDLINFLVGKFNGNFYLFNLILATFLVLSVYLYSSVLPQRFFVLLLSFPYLFVVVGMGFVRQGLAISFIFICMYLIHKNKIILQYVFLFFAVLSHKSSIIYFGISFFVSKKNFFVKIFVFSIIFLFLFYFLKNDLMRQFYYYVGEGVHLESKGSIFRNIFNTLPVLIFFSFYRRYKLFIGNQVIRVYIFLSLLQILSLVISLEISTFADRLTIYSIPLQLFVYASIPSLFSSQYKSIINILILILYNFYFLIWILFGQYTIVWSNYENILFEYFIDFPVGHRTYN